MFGRSSWTGLTALSVRVAVGGVLLVGALLWAASRAEGDQSAGIFALAGVLAGGLITAGTTWLFEKRREDGDLRQASRLIAEELRTIYFHYELLVEDGTAPNSTDGFLPTEQWQARRDVLARHLPDEVWDGLSPFMDSVASSRWIILRTEPRTRPASDVMDKMRNARDLASDSYKLLTGRRPGQV